MPQLLVIRVLLLIILTVLSRQTASAKSGQNNGGLVWWQEALEILQKGWHARTQVGQKIPACVVLNSCAAMALRVKKPFADEPFGYFVATK